MTTQAVVANDFLGQRRIALVGVSRDARDLSRSLFRELRSRGYDVLATEIIDAVTDRNPRALGRPPGVRWYGVTCYDFGTPRPKWHFHNCAEEYERHPDWDLVIGQGFDAGNGVPSPVLWTGLATKLGRGIAWWVE